MESNTYWEFTAKQRYWFIDASNGPFFFSPFHPLSPATASLPPVSLSLTLLPQEQGSPVLPCKRRHKTRTSGTSHN